MLWIVKHYPFTICAFVGTAIACKSQLILAGGNIFGGKLGRKLAKWNTTHTKITYWNIIFINLYGKLFCWWKICKFFNTTFTIFLPFTCTTLWQVILVMAKICFNNVKKRKGEMNRIGSFSIKQIYENEKIIPLSFPAGHYLYSLITILYRRLYRMILNLDLFNMKYLKIIKIYIIRRLKLKQLREPEKNIILKTKLHVSDCF